MSMGHTWGRREEFPYVKRLITAFEETVAKPASGARPVSPPVDAGTETSDRTRL